MLTKSFVSTFEFGLEFTQPLLDRLARTDAETDAGKSQRFAGGIELAASLGKQPRHIAVRIDEPIFLAEQITGAQRAPDAHAQTRDVLNGMDNLNVADPCGRAWPSRVRKRRQQE